MKVNRRNRAGRRKLLQGALGLPLLAACATTARNDFRLPDSFCGSSLPPASAADVQSARVRIAAMPAQRALKAGSGSADSTPRKTAIWTYADATQPELDSPIIRARQGELLPVLVENRLPAPTTVHWHGLRLHNAMDGVPEVTQQAIAAGERFLYRLACRDAGTFWYHPHLMSQEQLVRGLGGALIVAEDQPVPVEQDLVWVLKDWLLDADQQIRGDFEDTRDMSHAGRIGNHVTINGEPAQFADSDPRPLRIPIGARVRLRLINAASARSFVLKFESDSGFVPTIAALDGFPCPLHQPPDGVVVIAAAQRVDLLFDMPDGRIRIREMREPRRGFMLRELLSVSQVGQSQSRGPLIALPANRWLEPKLDQAKIFDVLFEGGARGQLKQARVGRESLSAEQMLDRYNMNWTINGVASREHQHAPFIRVSCNDSVLLRMRNDTQWQHPIHLHGFHFKVLTVDGQAPRVTTHRDTIMMEPRSRAEIAFVADSPGIWMFHCHILQHQAGGMMAAIEVI